MLSFHHIAHHQGLDEMTDVPKVYGAISAVMAHMSKEGIAKTRNNEQQRYKFRGIDDIYNALSSVLSENRLIMLPFVQAMEREERQTKSGGVINYTILTIDFTLVSAEDGSKDVVRMVGEAMDSADKSSNKAQSAALKYAALQVFMIPTEGDDNDADATTHEELRPRQQTKSRVDEPPEGWGDWTRNLIEQVYGTKVEEGLDELRDNNKRFINSVGKIDQTMFDDIGAAFKKRRQVLNGAEPF